MERVGIKTRKAAVGIEWWSLYVKIKQSTHVYWQLSFDDDDITRIIVSVFT